MQSHLFIIIRIVFCKRMSVHSGYFIGDIVKTHWNVVIFSEDEDNAYTHLEDNIKLIAIYIKPVCKLITKII